MNELTLIQSFRAERDVEPAEAREAIWRALEARMDAAAAEARAFGEAVAGSGTPGALGAPRAEAPARRRRGLSRRRRLGFAFAGAAAGAAVVAGALVLSSGPTAEPAAAAEILHEAATAAAAADAPATLVPGPGQFLYREEQQFGIVGWLYPVPAKEGNRGLLSGGAPMKGPGAFNALESTTHQWWIGPDGAGRSREVASTPVFWSTAEEARWKAAGSPFPSPFNAEYQQRYMADETGEAIEVKPGVIDLKTPGYGNYSFPDTSKLPTEAEALRHAVEANEIEVSGFNLMFGPKPTQLDTEQTKEELINLMLEGSPSPALQAAIFNALAELPGIAVETGATDGLGRQGDAIQLQVTEGVRSEYIFDPTTGEILASRSVLVDPSAAGAFLEELPAGTTISEWDYIETGVVDSTKEKSAAAR